MRIFAITFSIFAALTTSLGFTFCLADDAPRALYDKGKYLEALEALQKQGIHTAADFYDAANCYYRIGKVGQSISYYEKALSLAPQSEDIRFNLKLAVAAAEKTGSVAKDQTLWMGTIVPFVRLVPEYVAEFLFAICAAALAFVCYRLKSQSLRIARAVVRPEFLAAFAAWSLTGAATAIVMIAHQTELAAIVADVAIGRSGPAETFTELFKVPAGTKVELTGETRDGWRQIRFSLGNVGWIMDKDLLKL